MKITLVHLSPYLPHKIDFACIDPESGEWTDNGVREINFSNETILVGNFEYDFSDIGGPELKPILRPLSDIDREIEVNGNKFIPLEELNAKFGYEIQRLTLFSNAGLGWICEGMGYNFTVPMKDMVEPIQKLYEWHFDVFDLHARGLCIYKDEI